MNKNLKSLENLQNCGISINKWAEPLFCIFPRGCFKKVEFGNKYHLEVFWNNKDRKLYCTNSPAFRNESITALIESGIRPDTIIMDCSEQEQGIVKLYSLANKDYDYLYHILTKDANGNYSYDDKPLVIPTKKSFISDISYFRKISLEALFKKEFATNKTIKSMGGKKKAENQTGYQKVKMMFQHKNGECPNEEIKSLVDAYKICAPFLKGYKGKTMGLKGFRKNIKFVENMYDGYSVDCGSYLIYLSFEGSSLYYKNNTIENTDNIIENLNLENNCFEVEGTSSPKDNNKKDDQPPKRKKIGLIELQIMFSTSEITPDEVYKNFAVSRKQIQKVLNKINTLREEPISYLQVDTEIKEDTENKPETAAVNLQTELIKREYEKWCENIPVEYRWTFEEWLNEEWLDYKKAA